MDHIVYLGALGSAPDSTHLASRQEVGTALAAAGVAVVELRAAVVFGSGSISFEMLRCLTERLPAMVCPRWVRTRIQPIGLTDLLDYLEQSLSVAPGVYEIGGADVTTYRDMIAEYARVRGLRPRRRDRHPVAHATPVIVLGRSRDAGRSSREPCVDREPHDRGGGRRRRHDTQCVLGRADGGRAGIGRRTR